MSSLTLTWALQVGTQSTEMRVLIVASPYPLLHHSQISKGEASQIALQSHEIKPEWEFPWSDPQCWGGRMSTLGSHVPLEEP